MKNTDPIALFAAVAAHCRQPWAFSESAKFGSNALHVRGKIFAALTRQRQLLLKLPPARIDALLAAHRAERFVSGGRVMNGWVVVAPTDAAEWIALSDEAREHVGAEDTRRKRRS